MNTLILVRHGHAESNAGDTVNSAPPGGGLSAAGSEEARALGLELANEPIGLGVSSRLRRAQETLALALAGRDVPTIVEPLLDEIGFGSFEGGGLDAYRAWAWEHDPADPCPGGGESRAAAAARLARGLGVMLGRPEELVLAVSHALPLRYVIDAARGGSPARRVEHVPHATPFRLERAGVERAVATLREWSAAPRFAATPSGG